MNDPGRVPSTTGYTLVRPPHLHDGDLVAIISPGRWMDNNELVAAAARLEKLGFRVQVHSQNMLREHQFAGSLRQRLDALQEVFENHDIRAIMLAKAGNGALHLLDFIDYSTIARNPKIFVGYSDATALLLAFHVRAGLVTFHGPMLYDLRESVDQPTWRWFREILVEGKTMRIDAANAPQVRVLRPGVGIGTLLGGNLTLLANLVGTSTDFDPSGRILFLEDYDEKLYRIDRLLLHLRRAGKLARLSGLIVGEMHKIGDDQIPFGYSVDELVVAHCEGTNFPIISNCPFGHGTQHVIMPIGVPARLSANETSFSFELLEAAVS